MERHMKAQKCETTSKEHARQTKKKISKYISCKKKTKEKASSLLNREESYQVMALRKTSMFNAFTACLC